MSINLIFINKILSESVGFVKIFRTFCVTFIMPIPTPNKDEPKSKFISRCIATVTKVDPKRDSKQVAAICYTEWKNKKKKAKGSIDINGDELLF